MYIHYIYIYIYIILYICILYIPFHTESFSKHLTYLASMQNSKTRRSPGRITCATSAAAPISSCSVPDGQESDLNCVVPR